MSLRVLNRCPRLLVFPILQDLFLVLLVGGFLFWIHTTQGFEAWLATDESGEREAGFYIALGVVGLAGYLIYFFFRAALVAGTFRYLGGEKALIGGALADSVRVFPQIFGWAAAATTVGHLVRLVEKNRTGRAWLGRLLDTAWKALTYLVIPIIVVERRGPIGAVRRSGELLRVKWGSALIGNFSVGFFAFLLTIPVFLLAAFLFYLGFHASTAQGAIVTIACGLVVAVVGLSFDSALNNIFRAVLYTYSTGQPLPGAIQDRHASLEEAFRSRRFR